MDSTFIIAFVLVVLLIIAGLAWGTHKAGFRVKKATVKTPIFEAEMERKPADEAALVTDDVKPVPAQFSQEASDGGVIREAKIHAPADSAAGASQKAEGKGSRLDDVEIKLD